MKKFSRYLPSLIASVLLLFSVLGCIGASVSCINISQERLISQSRSNNITATVRKQLEKHFAGRAGSTHVPAEVYMNAVTDEELSRRIEEKIQFGFAVLNGTEFTESDSEIPQLNSSIEEFYSNYAAENKITDKEQIAKAAAAAEKSAYDAISEQCDVYKFSALKEHGVLNMAAKFYRYRFHLLAVTIAAIAALALILLIINHKERSAFLYWFGVSTLNAGLLGTIPCVYLLASRYFYAFSIKQQQVFESYTKAMTSFTEAFMAAAIACSVVGIAMFIIYGVANSKNKSVAPTDVSTSE